MKIRSVKKRDEDKVAGQAVSESASEVVEPVVDPAAVPAMADASDAVGEPASESNSDSVEVAEVDSQRADDLYWAEVRLAGSMAEVERKRVDLEDEIEQKKKVVAEVEHELNELESGLSDLREQHKQETDRLLGLARKLMSVSIGKRMPTEENAPEVQEENGWRLLGTAELCDGIKGLSKKKMETLVEAAATVGDLEDLRGEASKQCKLFCKLLPKGIGEGVAQAIEDRLVKHVKDWTLRRSDPDRSKLADELVSSLRKAAEEWTVEDCSPGESDDPHLHAGFTAFREGLPYTEFLSEDRAKAQLWMTGWVGGERLAAIGSRSKAG